MPEEKVSRVDSILDYCAHCGVPRHIHEYPNATFSHAFISKSQRCMCYSCLRGVPCDNLGALGHAPAADAGPRQPDTCGEPAASFIPRWGMSFACVLPKGHEGEHKQGGTCFKHGEYVGEKCPKWPDCSAPVPQEAAPDTKWNDEMPRDNRFHDPLSPAPAPDWAMRVAFERYARPEGYRLERKRFMISGQPMFGQYEEDVTQSAWISFMAGADLIRQAGSREPDGWAHRYHNCIRFNQGQEVNGEKPSEAVPYWLGTPGEAGSERERELEGKLRRSYELAHIFAKKIAMLTLSEKSYDEYSSALKELAEASRLLGGESD